MNDPVALPDIDPIDRLAILAAALPGAAVGQRRIAARKTINVELAAIGPGRWSCERFEIGLQIIGII